MFNFSDDNCVNIAILIIIVLLILLFIRKYVSLNEENFATDLEAVANVASLYNTGNFQVDNMNVTQNATIGESINVAKNVNAEGTITTNGGLVTSGNTPEGGYISIKNNSKTGSKTGNWTIFNMTSGYGDALKFWRYGADGSNPGQSVTFFDNGDVDMTNNLNVHGALKVDQIDYTNVEAGLFPLTIGSTAECQNGYYVAGFDNSIGVIHVKCRKLPGA